MNKQISTKKQKLTGKHVIMYIIGFFVVIFIANGFFIYFAVNTFRGEDNKQSYRQGVEYNKTIAERRKQMALGWNEAIHITADKMVLTMTNADGKPLSGLNITALFKHPTDLKKDRKLKFAEDLNNNYITNLDADLFGKNWILIIEAKSANGERFKSRNKIWLKSQ